jgi:ABC-2 type transport system ATP-binding protein
MITNLRDLGKTVFLTTHFMDEAEALADRLAVIANGHIIAEGTPETLGHRDESRRSRARSLLPRSEIHTGRRRRGRDRNQAGGR